MIKFKDNFYRVADISDYLNRTWESPKGTRTVVTVMNVPNGPPMLAVNTEGLLGNQLFTVEDLEDEIERDTKNLEFRARQERERREEEEQLAQERKNLDRFLATIRSPRLRGRMDAALNKVVNVNGEPNPRYKHIENLVDAGYRVGSDPTFGRVLESPRGSFLTQKDLTKTALDYAEFLTGK